VAVGILLVGGRGTRLQPLTNGAPKPMLPIAGLPVTEHQILAAKAAGIHTIVLATSYLAEVFTPYFGDGARWGVKILYAIEKEPLGTGGAIRNAAELLANNEDTRNEPIVIFNGDVLSKHSITKQLAFHAEKEAAVTLHLITVEDARAFGCVPIDANGRVSAFLEKMENPVTNLINAGCYIFQPEVIAQIPLNQVVSIEREVFPQLVAQSAPVFGYHEQAYWLDVGTPAALFKGSADFVAAPFLAMPGAIIDESAQISGGSAIGARSEIAAGAVIEGCIIGSDVKVGEGVQLTRSFIGDGIEIAAGSVLHDRYLCQSEDLPISF
jgi:mannose-1-phosphate guanylyltransferase